MNTPQNDATVSFDYQYNSANQRTRATTADGSYWIYEYDNLGQVTSGKKYWSDGSPISGQQFEYGFDDIGNRKSTASGGNEWGTGLRFGNYTANFLNQYTARTVPGAVDVIGAAAANATVTVNNQPTYRRGEYFRHELAIGNQASAISQSVTNLAVLNNGTNPDIVTNSTGRVLLPKAAETFVHDLDGNLTSDNGRQWGRV